MGIEGGLKNIKKRKLNRKKMMKKTAGRTTDEALKKREDELAKTNRGELDCQRR